MFKNYYRIAIRSLQNNSGYSFINITGLAIGMGIALMIGLWIADECSFDAYHSNYKSIAVVMERQGSASSRTWAATFPVVVAPLGEKLRHGYQDLFTSVAQVSLPADHILVSGDKKVSRSGLWAQSSFPVMFTYHMEHGSINALNDPSTLMLSHSLSVALFGNVDPTGKSIRLDDMTAMKVGGVFEDLPFNTTFHDIALLLPWTSKDNVNLNASTDWGDHNSRTYVQLAPGVSTEQAGSRISKLITEHVKDWREESFLYPIGSLHLYDNFVNGKPDGGFITQVWLFGIIGVVVLLLACINFMNLSTARSERRSREVGIRKTLGTSRWQLIIQFLGESVMVAFLSLILALMLVSLTLPYFNLLAVKEISIPWANPIFLGMVFGFTLMTGILAGSYPALYLSGFQAVKVLKGHMRLGRAASTPRQILVVTQFVVSLVLIIGTIVIYRQIAFTKDRPLGYLRNGLITVPINTDELRTHRQTVVSELTQLGIVESAAISSEPTTQFINANFFDWEGKQPSENFLPFRDVSVTSEFGKTVGWTILQGRDFSRSFLSDSDAAIISEAAAKTIGFKNPIGKTISYHGQAKRYTIVGVVGDILANSPYKTIVPVVFLGSGADPGVFTLRLKSSMPVRTSLDEIGKVFSRYNPSSPFIYTFNDQDFARKFAAEERVGHLATVFAVLAIFISCLGLFGLAAYVAEQRKREIGVRKVLGASVTSLWKLQSYEFLGLVGISLVLAIPVSYWMMGRWLQNYAYHASMPWWIFAASGMGILIITLATVSFQSLRAALMNPVKSLRVE
jgi:putative ABC transport system permease protein